MSIRGFGKETKYFFLDLLRFCLVDAPYISGGLGSSKSCQGYVRNGRALGSHRLEDMYGWALTAGTVRARVIFLIREV